MPALRDREAEFIHRLATTGHTPAQAARALGYAEPDQAAS